MISLLIRGRKSHHSSIMRRSVAAGDGTQVKSATLMHLAPLNMESEYFHLSTKLSIFLAKTGVLGSLSIHGGVFDKAVF